MSLAACLARPAVLRAALLARRAVPAAVPLAHTARCLATCALVRPRWAAAAPLCSSTSRRGLHSSSLASSLIDPTGPTSATFDAPLPTLAPVASIDPTELTIAESTVRRLGVLARKAAHPVHLRVLVDQGGCSGLEYKFEVEHDTQPSEEDVVITLPGEGDLRVYVDRDSWLWLRGSRIEYLEELSRAAFVVAENPNATSACGCKSSFAPKIDPRLAAP